MPHTPIGRHTLTPLGQARGVAALPWWNPDGATPAGATFGAWQAKAAASFAASLIDLTGNGNNLGDPGGAGTPGWDAINGWIGDGIADHLTTTFVPANDQSQTVLVQFTGLVATTLTDYLCGATNAGGSFAIGQSTVINRCWYGNGVVIGVIPALAAGNLAVAGNTAYRDGAPDGGPMGVWGGASTRTVYLLALNLGFPTNFVAANVQAFVIYQNTLTGPQVLARAVAMAAL